MKRDEISGSRMIKMRTVVLYHRKTDGSIKVWQCWVEGSWVYSKWGKHGGMLQFTKEQSDGSADAIALFEKRVRGKLRKGYKENYSEVVDSVRVNDDELDFARLPRSFSPAKPIKKVDLDTARSWEKDDLLMIQRKRDGLRHFLVSDAKSNLKIYSSGKDNLTEHLAPLLKGLVLPPRTILDCELVVTEPGVDDKDGFLTVAGICRSLAPRAQHQIRLARQDGCKVQLMAFDLLWLNGVAIYRTPYLHRWTKLGLVVVKANKEIQGSDAPLIRMPAMEMSLDRAIDEVKKHKWEGLVLWRTDQHTVVQVNGTPKRVNCWKLKPVQEDDVVALGYERGKGKNSEVVGKFRIALVRGVSDSGRLEYRVMGKCGTGLTDELREEALGWKYPCVIQIEYDQRSEKGFRFPVFIRRRTDKRPHECTE